MTRRTCGQRVLGLAIVALAMGLVSTMVPGGVAASAGTATRAVGAASDTVWLCRPGRAGDPCAFNTAATSVAADGTKSTPAAVIAPEAHNFDCFYVYPTVSREPGDNANLAIQPAEVGAAVVQASQFSQVCNVWAPMYRQVTTAGLLNGGAFKPSVIATAYNSLLSAWRDYLAHENDGRPVVFIGHSQGAAMLIKLLRAQVDPSPTLRKRMVSALILGGNVQVPQGADVGGTFRNIPACRSASSTRCVIAYSTFGATPPADAIFGRPGQGVSLQSGQTTKSAQQVVCVNPATFSAQAGALEPYFISSASNGRSLGVTTPWVTFPGLYTAQCEQQDGATWLQVTTTAAPGDPRPTVTDSLGPAWGYHLQDVNLALGNLVADVASQEAAYR